MEQIQKQQLVGIWQLIPRNAFLYFPEGQQIKIGTKQKQWRKIFENNQKFDQWQEEALKKLEQKLVVSSIRVHPWFDNANKLRYLQANKWKKTPTCEAITQYSKYRYSSFPIKETPQIASMLTKGTFYFCGRDQKYRPIIVADISKFHEKDIQLIPPTLVYLMEFMINNLLIEGQVENYVLIMNLESFSMGQKSLVSKILGFTSNSYRGRLYVSYLLGAPGLLRFGWNSLASNFVSENTLRKIKVTGDLYHQQMWTHIDKQIIQKKYGGTCDNISSYWPVLPQKMLFESPQNQNKFITVDQYNRKFQNTQLQKCKVLKSLIRRKSMSVRDLNKSTIIQEQINPIIQSKKVLERIDLESLTNTTILIESSIFPQELKSIRTFFQSQAFLCIKQSIKQVN